jgi:hypothetical protein
VVRRPERSDGWAHQVRDLRYDVQSDWLSRDYFTAVCGFMPTRSARTAAGRSAARLIRVVLRAGRA